MRTDVPLTPVPFERRVESPLWDILIPRSKHSIALSQGMKRCTCCGTVKPLHAFHRQANGTGGRINHCKVCRSRAAVQRKRAA